MYSSYTMFNIAVESGGIMTCLLGIMLITAFRGAIERRTKQHFHIFFGFLLIDLLCIAETDYYTGRAAMSGLIFVVHFIHLFVIPLLGYAISYYLIDIIELKVRLRRTRLLLRTMMILHVAILLVCQGVFHAYASVVDGVIVRGPLYPEFVARSTLPLIVNIVLLLRYRKLLTRREKLAFWGYELFPALALLPTVLVDSHHIVYSTYFAGLVMFLFILVDRVESYSQQQKKSSELRTAIMLSQIQPHFLFNSLDVILDLCYTDPMQAARATEKFSAYLRRNIDAVKAEKPVAFADELEHTKTYVELEQMRFLDHLKVNWEVGCTDFRIPSLTLQPIVENAVRHGVRRREGGGTVTVRVRDLPEAYEISVADDGPGFDPDKPLNDGRTHVGLQNVRERLKRISGGELRIDSALGTGTTVTILLPKKGDNLT